MVSYQWILKAIRGANMSKKVQISEELFLALYKYIHFDFQLSPANLDELDEKAKRIHARKEYAANLKKGVKTND